MIFIYGFITGTILTFVVSWLLFKANQKASTNLIIEGLDPFKEQIEKYQVSLNKMKEINLEQNTSLKTQLSMMFEQTQKVEKEASSLSQALTGNVKSQGIWGEVILERVLETSGLKKDREYVLQGEGLQLKNNEGSHLKPDAIINLPNDRFIVIDSKVSVKSILENDEKALKTSLKKHIDSLSSKDYQKVAKINSVDFVILFIPLESMMSLIFSDYETIVEYGVSKNIILASPLSLMPILRTINTMWSSQRQSENAQKIAREAGLMFDKFSSFKSDFDKLRAEFLKVTQIYDDIDRKVFTGQGSINSKIDKLKELS